MKTRKEAVKALLHSILKAPVEPTEEWLRECLSHDDLAAYLVAPSGWTIAVYLNGTVHVGDAVGHEIEPSERPIATAKCPGIGQADMTCWRADWECSDLGDEEVIRQSCRHGDVEGEMNDLIMRLLEG